MQDVYSNKIYDNDNNASKGAGRTHVRGMQDVYRAYVGRLRSYIGRILDVQSQSTRAPAPTYTHTLCGAYAGCIWGECTADLRPLDVEYACNLRTIDVVHTPQIHPAYAPHDVYVGAGARVD